jgi:hypothetical protein
MTLATVIGPDGTVETTLPIAAGGFFRGRLAFDGQHIAGSTGDGVTLLRVSDGARLIPDLGDDAREHSFQVPFFVREGRELWNFEWTSMSVRRFRLPRQ